MAHKSRILISPQQQLWVYWYSGYLRKTHLLPNGCWWLLLQGLRDFRFYSSRSWLGLNLHFCLTNSFLSSAPHGFCSPQFLKHHQWLQSIDFTRSLFFCDADTIYVSLIALMKTSQGTEYDQVKMSQGNMEKLLGRAGVLLGLRLLRGLLFIQALDLWLWP